MKASGTEMSAFGVYAPSPDQTVRAATACVASETAVPAPAVRSTGVARAALALLLALSGVSVNAVPPHTGEYIDPAGLMSGVCSAGQSRPTCDALLLAEAVKYFLSIGVYTNVSLAPSAQRGSFSSWKQTFGFSPNPTQPAPDELRATYFNNGDLQLGRDMHCRVQSFAPSPGNFGVQTYACYVSNFSNSTPPQPGPLFNPTTDPHQSIALAATPGSTPAATVAMELTAARLPIVSVGPARGPPSFSFQFGDVFFLAYDKDGWPLRSPPLDSEGPKAVPGLCMACHGGTYIRSTPQSLPRVVGANFLPFDTSTFLYASSGPLTEVAQREVFRKLNAFVQSTRPARRTISDLISGWYQWCGGVGTANCFIDDVAHAFVPGDPALCGPNSTFCSQTCQPSNVPDQTCGWASGQPPNAGNKPGFDVRGLYTQVVAKLCRTCHIALADRFNVQNFSSWTNDPRTYGFVNGISPARTSIHAMPAAEVPFINYWNNVKGANGEGASDYFEAFFTTGQTPRQACQSSCISGSNSCLVDCGNAQHACDASSNGPERARCGKDGASCRSNCTAITAQCNGSCPRF